MKFCGLFISVVMAMFCILNSEAWPVADPDPEMIRVSEQLIQINLI